MFWWTLTPQAPRRRPGRVEFVVAVVAVVLLAAGAYLLSRTHERPRPAATATASPAGPTGSAGPAGSAGRGTGPRREVAPGGVDLTGVSWRDFHGVRLPYSRTNGPAGIGGDRAWGFADSAGGAVFAAVHIGVRANAQWGPDIFEPTVDDQIDGPDKPTLLSQLDSAYAQLADGARASGGGPIGRAYAVEEAFRVQSFTPDAATVDVVTAGPGTNGATVRTATRIQLIRHDHDWRVLAPPGGDWGASAHVIDSLDGYRSFGDQADDQAGDQRSNERGGS